VRPSCDQARIKPEIKPQIKPQIKEDVIAARGTAVVTGAAQGIGRAVCERLALDGFDVAVLDLDGGGAERVAAAVGGRGYSCDVTDPASLQAVADELGPISALVNNAGIFRAGSLVDGDLDALDVVLRTNLMGTVYAVRAFGKGLRSSDSAAVVNLSSVAAVTASPQVGSYPASKSAIETVTRQLAQELGPDGVRVNAIGPGFIRTEGTEASYAGGGVERRAAGVPLRRVGGPADIAAVVSFLCGADSAYVNGQIIYVDGGISAGSAAG
jgi:NAD(P)-dependent dehydrogenase (short-subunit alcohol dehydrogenase family)